MADQRVTDPLPQLQTNSTAVIRTIRGKWVRRTIIAVALALPCIPFVLMGLDVYNSRRERHRLLHETDHQALLAASRKLMQEVGDETIFDPAQDPRVPLIIRQLGPSYLTVSPRQLSVELHGGFEHYGFRAFPNDESDPGFGRQKLIDGLFYYEE